MPKTTTTTMMTTAPIDSMARHEILFFILCKIRDEANRYVPLWNIYFCVRLSGMPLPTSPSPSGGTHCALEWDRQTFTTSYSATLAKVELVGATYHFARIASD